MLAHVLHELSHAGINVEEMDNVIVSGQQGACAHIHLDAEPTPAVLDRVVAGSQSVLGVSLIPGKTA